MKNAVTNMQRGEIPITGDGYKDMVAREMEYDSESSRVCISYFMRD